MSEKMKKPVTKEEQDLLAVNCFVFYMANQWCREEALRIFGEDMGSHFFGKWAAAARRVSPDHATVILWYAMSDTYRQKLIDAAVIHYEPELRE